MSRSRPGRPTSRLDALGDMHDLGDGLGEQARVGRIRHVRFDHCRACPHPVRAKPADFADLDILAERLAAFEARYNVTARPFDWTFTRADLVGLCGRIDAQRVGGPPALAA